MTDFQKNLIKTRLENAMTEYNELLRSDNALEAKCRKCEIAGILDTLWLLGYSVFTERINGFYKSFTFKDDEETVAIEEV